MRNLPLKNLLRHSHLNIAALHLLVTLQAMDVRREDLGLDLRLDPLLQAPLARVDQVVAGLSGVVVRELRRGAVLQAGMAWVALDENSAALGGGRHRCGGNVGGGCRWVEG